MGQEKLKRCSRDGQVNVVRAHEGDIVLGAVTDGNDQSIIVTEWNARRLLGLLSMILDIPITKAAAKTIEM